MDKIELLGGACFSHGPYTFYKAVRIGNERVLRLGSFFLTKLWTDADLVSIGELQLLWLDSRGSNQPLASLRLYFLPENTPDGRRNTHGEDEVLTISEKVVVRVHDLVTWLSPSVEWSWGREISIPQSVGKSSSDGVGSPKYDGSYPQVLTDPGIDFTDVDKQQKEFESNRTPTKKEDSFSSQPRVVVLSYPRYCRYRALLRRLEGAEPSWLCSSVAAALGGFTALPGTKVLFCRDTFDYPDLETHELLCNHLAPKLKGRPRRKRKKRSVSPGESSNESEASVASTSRGASTTASLVPALRPPSSGVRRSERNTSAEEKRFLTDVHGFMSSRGTPVGKMPLLGYRQIDLFLFYTKVQKFGGYDTVSAGRLWKTIYDDIGGNTGSTSAATITRRHYERLLLPYERHQKGEETKVRPAHGRRTKSSSMSDDSTEAKPEVGRTCASETPPPMEAPTAASPVPPVPSILSSSPFLPGDKPKTEGGKTSSLRSVRVKPERLKSLSTIIANSATVVSPNGQQLPSPSPPPSSNSSTTPSTPSTTPSTTPTSVGAVGQSVLERQLNSPLISHQLPPSSPPPCSPVSAANATVVTLTPPPERDLKEIKLDPKAATLLAQGKENIPLFGEKPIFAEKALVPPKSPEVIDLELENDASRDKIVIPSFKKRKLEILREGGLEVTAVELESRPSVIQATIIPVSAASPLTLKSDERTSAPPPVAPTTNSAPKLISVTVTPDIGHMLPSPHEHRSGAPSPARNPTTNHNHQTFNQTSPVNGTSSRVINVGSPNNASLLQLYANSLPSSASPSPPIARFATPNERLSAPPKVTQSRSIFAHNERTVYGNPKDILIPSKYHHHHQQHNRNSIVQQPIAAPQATAILDLTQKQSERSFARPNLEIVRVPVVPRPNPLNLEMKSPPTKAKLPFTGYPGMLDSRTMASNNLEITLVNPKHRAPSAGQARQPSPSPPSARLAGNHTQRRNQNGKFPARSEPIATTYAPRKPSQQVIPNVPNLHGLNSAAYAARIVNPQHQIQQHQQQHMYVDRRKTTTNSVHNQRRTSESEKANVGQQLQQHVQQVKVNANQRQDLARRHSVPNSLASGFAPPANQPNSFAQMPPSATGKFVPMLDPLYYSAFYNGLFPAPIPNAAAPYVPPEFSAYYKELLASSQPRIAVAGQHQPAVPTSK